MPMLDDAIQAIRMGDKDEGRRLLEEILESDESNEDVWLHSIMVRPTMQVNIIIEKIQLCRLS